MSSPPILDLKNYLELDLLKSQYTRYNYGVDDLELSIGQSPEFYDPEARVMALLWLVRWGKSMSNSACSTGARSSQMQQTSCCRSSEPMRAGKALH
jgi:hypothetical protein